MSLELLRRLGACVTTLAAVVTLCGGVIAFVPAAEAESAPVKLAVFDFELEDGSAGATIAGDPARDEALMVSVSTEVRKVLGQSQRYQLVDVSSAGATTVQNRELRNCNGCETAIALSLGADQSLVGVVKRITRTEYVVSFQLRDTRSGTLLASQQSDLQMGANYSWSRGAVRLIKDRLLATSH